MPHPISGTASLTTSRFRPSEKFTVAEFAEMLGLPVEAVKVIIAKNRTAIRRSFYNISQLAERWGVSRAQVYNILREADFKVLNIASKSSEERQSWRIPASVVEKIEQSRMEHLPEVAA
jgi:DNA-binding phage protein